LTCLFSLGFLFRHPFWRDAGRKSVRSCLKCVFSPNWCRQPMCHNLRMNADKKATRIQPAAEQVDLAVEVFRMLAESTRVGLLWALLDGELAVNELAEAVGKPAAAVSQHLAKLRMSRLVRTRRAGTQVFYRIESSHVRTLVEDAIFHAEHAGGGVPEHHRGEFGVLEPGTTASAPRAERPEAATR